MSATPSRPLLLQALAQPGALPRWSVASWELLLQQARRARLAARLATRLQDAGQLDAVPAPARAHLQDALLLALAQQAETWREIRQLRRALGAAGVPLVLLKGAAYVAAGLPPAAGRLFSDTDLLVPRQRLDDVERQLQLHGWQHDPQLSAYDRHYYRAWMHELPPLTHLQRGTVVDVHHAILPLTARHRPDADALLAASVAVAGDAGLRVLAPVDMVLHAMAHLFHNEEFDHGLRDLSDLDLLLRHFAAAQPNFWTALQARALTLDLARTLHHGLRCVHRLLDTPVPPAVLRAAATHGPGALAQPLMDALWARALGPGHVSTTPPFTGTARALLFVRAHWLRMPLPLLLRHAAAKTAQALQPAPSGGTPPG